MDESKSTSPIQEWIDNQRKVVAAASWGNWLLRYGGGPVEQLPGYHREKRHFEIRLDPEEYGTDVINAQEGYVVMSEDDGRFIEDHNPVQMTTIYEMLKIAVKALENIQRPITSPDRAEQARSALQLMEKCLEETPGRDEGGNICYAVKSPEGEIHGFVNQCRFGSKCGGHAVYCNNDKSQYRKCPYGQRSGGTTPETECEVFEKNPYWQELTDDFYINQEATFEGLKGAGLAEVVETEEDELSGFQIMLGPVTTMPGAEKE